MSTTSTRTRLPRRDLVFDGLVFAGGLLIAVASLARWAAGGIHPTVAALVAVALLPVINRFPFQLSQKAGDSNIGLEPFVLVFLVLTGSASQALALWALGQVLSQFSSKRSTRVRLFDFGIILVAGSALVLVARWGNHGTLGELVLVLAGCIAYFVLDITLTAVSLALEARGPVLDAVPLRSLPVALLVFLGINTMGYLAAMLERGQPSWTLLLPLIPITTILVATRSISRSQLAHEQLTGLLDATAQAPDWAGDDSVEDALLIHAEKIVRLSDARIGDDPPGPAEIGAILDVEGRPRRYLVAARRANAEMFGDEDHKALLALASVAVTMLSRRRLADEMAFRARHDVLTGLANRATFTDRLEHGLQRRQRNPQAILAVIYCDLDRFKNVNDSLGHHFGDRVLVGVAERLRGCLRPADTAARLGGDEFAILLEDLPDPGGAEQAAERILQSLNEPLVLDGRPISVRASLGLAYPEENTSAAELIRLADTAMYRAKSLGRGRLATFQHSLQTGGVHRLELESRLRQAITDGMIRPHLQPMVDLMTGEITGFEALARWTDPVLGAVPPDVFIPIAEQLDLIDGLGRQMLAQSHAVAVRLLEEVGRPFAISVNLAPSQVADPVMLEMAESLRAQHVSVPLTLEVTERTVLGHDEQTVAVLHRLRTAGVRLSVDDFGVGYSSIGHLHRFPLDVLKVDKSIVAAIDQPAPFNLVRGVLALAKAMQLDVVAEGVETWEQAAALQQVGCRYAQGYLFAHPLDEEAALQLGHAGTVDLSPLRQLTARREQAC